MKNLNRVAWVSAALVLSGCATARQEPAVTGLGDTDWVLIGFHKSGPEAELHEVHLYDYTMRLDGSGAARFKFDCNQGSSTWQARPSEAGKGTISFGPVATTTALCGAGSIGEMLSADISRPSRYTLDDGKLTMMPDGRGQTYVWDKVD